MSAREDLQNRLGRGLHEMSSQWQSIEQMLDAFEAEVRREAAEEIRDDARRKQGDPKRQDGKLRAAHLIDPTGARP